MRSRQVCMIMIALVLPAATAMAAPVTNDAPVRDVERTLAEARVRGDAPAVADLLADEYLGVDRFGQLHTRATVLSDGVMSVCEAVHLHGMVAVVVAHEGDLRVLRVWIARDMRWQLVAEQDVVIQPGRSDPDATWNAADVGDDPQFERVAIIRDVLRAQDALDRANAMRDPATFARLTDPDFVVVTSAGLVRSKADRVVEERIASLERQPERPAPKRDNVHVRLFGPTVAIVTARNWPRTFEGTPRPRTRYTRVWVKTVSGWQQAANISTVIVPIAP